MRETVQKVVALRLRGVLPPPISRALPSKDLGFQPAHDRQRIER